MPQIYYREYYRYRDVSGEEKAYSGTGYDKDGQFIFHGHGTVYYNSEPVIISNLTALYEGDFVDGKWHGKGKKYYESGALLYEGDYADHRAHGKGKWYYESGKLFYEGDFVEGNRHGKGKHYYESGALMYEGGWADGNWHGEGKWYYENGKLFYEGDFVEGNRYGKGKEYYESGALKYTGDYADGKWHGSGCSYYEDGTLYYAGQFVNGEPLDNQPSKQVSLTGTDADQYLAELDAMIGLDAVKRQVRELINVIRVQKERERRNLRVNAISYHMVFTGNPGTGKTTVARLIGKIYASLGVVSKGNVVETDRTGLVGEYIGHTGPKTDKKIEEAKGGILFIDEAYSIVPEGGPSNDFGKEAVDCLLKRMEDYREDLVVIVAGYEGPMQRFLESNPGLKSRFNHYIRFENYNLYELGRILDHTCRKNDAILRPEALDLFLALVEKKLADPAFQEEFSNGRYVRNVFDKLFIAQANRLSRIDFSTADNVTLNEILAEDLQYLVDNGDFDTIT